VKPDNTPAARTMQRNKSREVIRMIQGILIGIVFMLVMNTVSAHTATTFPIDGTTSPPGRVCGYMPVFRPYSGVMWYPYTCMGTAAH